MRLDLRVVGVVAIVVLLGGLVALVLRPGPLSEEDRVRAAISAVAEGARDADLGVAMAPVSPSYDDGTLDARTLRLLLMRELGRRGPISVVLSPVQVRIDPGGSSATATFAAVLAEGVELMAFDLVPDRAEVWDFEVSFAQVDDEWLIVDHTRSPSAG